MKVERIKSIREFCTENYHLLDNKTLFSLTLSSKDIDGGLNFIEEINYYRIGDKSWLCENVIQKTIQPDFGQTITSDCKNSTYELKDENLLKVLDGYPEALREFEAYEAALLDKGYRISE